MTGARVRRSHCKGCNEFSMDVGLIYAGKGKGYIELCRRCATELLEGESRIARSSDGSKLEDHSLDEFGRGAIQ